MARKKITQLPTGSSVSGPDRFVFVQAGTTKQITASGMATFFGSGGGGGGPGSTGPTGPAGAAGSAGTAGATGPTGVAGAAGAAGTAGATGPTGAQGIAGAAGATGPTGSASTVTGPTGAASAVTGPTGPTGTAGVAGSAGAAGATGPTGSAGSAGSAGATGPTGPGGASTQTSTGVTALASTGFVVNLAIGDFDVYYMRAATGVAVRSINITGTTGNTVKLLINDGTTGAITLSHATGSAGAQFRSPWSGDVVLPINGGSAAIISNGVDWRVL